MDYEKDLSAAEAFGGITEEEVKAGVTEDGDLIVGNDAACIATGIEALRADLIAAMCELGEIIKEAAGFCLAAVEGQAKGAKLEGIKIGAAAQTRDDEIARIFGNDN